MDGPIGTQSVNMNPPVRRLWRRPDQSPPMWLHLRACARAGRKNQFSRPKFMHSSLIFKYSWCLIYLNLITIARKPVFMKRIPEYLRVPKNT